ncbi:hypothetical protein DSO57_1028985 [Entomophthora muscae]|uniref:Uncharacterized protein n=1 Tax=Entomophthora muscae TaxID=34485 RepID=A0ACC2T170_9FUNG|nr:hypothetical protein DSO57_1028985 [Entomophthora muscae]
MQDSNILKGLPQVQKVWQSYIQTISFNSTIASNLQIISASEDGEVICKLKVEDIHLNPHKSMHGGFISSLVDIGGSLAIAAKGMFATGVSTDISATFLGKSAVGDIITMRSRCDKLGKSMAYTTTELLKIDPKTQAEKIIAHGRHTKFVLLAHEINSKLKSNL